VLNHLKNVRVDTVPQSATGLFGYLYLSGETEQLNEFFALIVGECHFLVKAYFNLGMPAGGLPFCYRSKRKQKRDSGASPPRPPFMKGLPF